MKDYMEERAIEAAHLDAGKVQTKNNKTTRECRSFYRDQCTYPFDRTDTLL
ncbi:MAG: hypothetical protein IJ733_14585 [Lachnospiraceae bacterium]|nr:hypothetical protein [Lachnospiraceae bacterium]